MIDPGVDGALFTVTASVDALLVPQLFDAVTLTSPDDVPKSITALIVP